MKIAMLYPNNPPFGVDTHDKIGLGGSENGFTRTAQHLVYMGHEVHVFNRQEGVVDYGALKWNNIATFKASDRYDVVYSLRHREPFHVDRMNAGLKVLFLADTESVGLGDDVRSGKIDLVMSVSNWQKLKIQNEEGVTDPHWYITSNGIDANLDRMWVLGKEPGRCLHMATPDRGITTLLDVWPRIREAAPHATLHCYSSFVGWGTSLEENEEMLQSLYLRMERMKDLGVVNKRHGKPEEIRQAMTEADVYLYPSDFSETCCMSVLGCMAMGAIPVTTAKAALLEKVIPNVTGFTVPSYGEHTDRYRDEFVKTAVHALTLSPEDRRRIRDTANIYAEQYTYNRLVPLWVQEWERRLKEKGWQ